MPHTIHGSTGYIPTIYIVDFFMVWKRRYLNIQPASHFFILCSLGLFQGRIYYQFVPMWRNVAQTDQAPPRRSVLLLKPLDLRRGVHQNETTGDGRSIQCLAPRPGPEGFMSTKPTTHATGRFTYMDGVRCCFLHRKNVGKYTMHGWSWMVWAWERNKRWKKRPGKHSVSFFWPL